MELSQKVKRKREIVKRRRAEGWSTLKIQNEVRVQHAEARQYVVEQFMPKGSVGAEVGVDWGDFAKIVIKFGPPGKYYLIDPWGKNQKKPGDRPKHVSDLFREQIRKGTVIVIQKTGLAAAPIIPDESLDWAYIDCSHKYQDIIDNIDAYLPKVKVGGYLIADDYDRSMRNQVAVANTFDEFADNNTDVVEVVLRDDDECQIVLRKLK